MTLLEIIQQLDQLNPGLTIYAAEPWHSGTSAITVAVPARPGDAVRLSATAAYIDSITAAGYRLFLTVDHAVKLLRHFNILNAPEPSAAVKCARLIELASSQSWQSQPNPKDKLQYPRKMTLYCQACGKHFEIEIPGPGPRNYQCSACQTALNFDLEAFIKKAVAQSKKMVAPTKRRPPL